MIANSEGTLPLLPDLFLEVASRHPERIAVDIPPSPRRNERTRITYRELRRHALLVAGRLRPCTHEDAIVVLCLERGSPHLYAAMLGSWLAGAAYCYLDPELPTERWQRLLDDVDPVFVLCDEASRPRVREHCGRTGFAEMEGLQGESHDEPGVEEVPWLRQTSLAYVIFTSGSSGVPKGVLLEHGGISNLVFSDMDYFGLGVEDRVAQGSSAAYDSSIEEIWLALSVGGTVVVMDDHTARLGPDLVEWLQQERVTVLCPPPTLLRSMQCRDPRSQLPRLKLLYVGGEALPRDIADSWAPGRHLENGYGPTECTVTVIRGRIEAKSPIVIGEPIRGHRAWVLDADLQPVAAGEIGELCIGWTWFGAGVPAPAKGETEQGFIQPPRPGANLSNRRPRSLSRRMVR